MIISGSCWIVKGIFIVRELINLLCLQQVRVLLKRLCRPLLGEVSINLADVFLAFHFRDEGRLYTLRKQIIPVDFLEKVVGFDLFYIQSLIWVSLEQFAQKIFSFFRESANDFNVALRDHVHDFLP